MDALEAVFVHIWLAFILSGAVSEGIGAERSGSGPEPAGLGALGLGFDFLRWLMKLRGFSLLVRLKGLSTGF